MREFDAFAEICKRYGLTKNEVTFRLFCAYQDIVFCLRHPDIDREGLPMVKLVQLLFSGGNVTITSAKGHSIELASNSFLKASLAMAANAILVKNFGNIYADAGLASKPKALKKSEGVNCLGFYFDDLDLYEPYEQEELSSIRGQEEIFATKKEKLKAYNNRRCARLGCFASELLEAIALEDYALYYSRNDEAIIALENQLRSSSLYADCPKKAECNSLIADLLEGSGAIKYFCVDSWQEVKDSGKYAISKQVCDWIDSYHNLKKNGIALEWCGFPTLSMKDYPQELLELLKTAFQGLDF